MFQPLTVATAKVDLPNWDDSEITVDAREAVGDGTFSPETPSTGPGDPRKYEFRLACTQGDIVIFEACRDVMPACASGANSPDGKPGTAIYWYYSDPAFSPPVWTFLSGPECVFGEKPRDVLAEIAGQIAHEFQRTPIAAAKIGSQPGPHTLRGKETNVWADAATQTFNLTMIGQKVTITATPVAYTWDYGDGTSWGPTPIHGAPLHEDRIGEQTQTSHVYVATGRLAINLTTHFNGTYTVNGGPELPISGQGNIPSPALPLTVWRAETHLYADNCFQNPRGVGC
ncbi:PKD domain-containing protein [Arthrobacter sp. HY1533]|uniref:PKD domain-containing protein n=1 Tax=Arthrobacter sp. HY1533 TaxID=2970919 RepID=UPI0022B9FD4A|nr:hypothetical protein [Arthrobacter sp. HY1533]